MAFSSEKVTLVIQDEDRKITDDYLEAVEELRLALATLDDAKNWPLATKVLNELRCKAHAG